MEPGAGMVWPLLLVLVSYALDALAYIPAHATNDTTGFSDTSSLVLQWYPESSYSETVSYQLVGADSTGISQGVLVHFTEEGLIAETTKTPWIALISCDANTTDFSTEFDIFTLARDRGAVSAVLYSNTSESCIVNPEYADPQLFDNVMDLFVIPSLALSRIVEDQFQQEDPSGTYSLFNPSALNASVAIVSTAIVNHTVSAPGLLFATLTAANATRPASSPTVPAPPATQTASIFKSMVKLAPWM
ncbi:hypothetical protein C8Q77DRAFT_751126 [Trametes polyzona]|nr:hypothetical protein C8Q77DRAFT_751126 [Trametes polyzona]